MPFKSDRDNLACSSQAEFWTCFIFQIEWLLLSVKPGQSLPRESRDNYIPDISALEQNVIEVDSETKDMLKMMDFQSIPGLQLASSSQIQGLAHKI